MENSEIAFADAGHAGMHASAFDAEQKEKASVLAMTEAA